MQGGWGSKGDWEEMEICLRASLPSDRSFLREMLYEAIFWRAGADRPSLEVGLAYPDSAREMAGWGERDGDTAVVAVVDGIPAGAAWYRFWSDSNFSNGFLDEDTPVLGIAVHSDYRHQGIGKKMLARLLDCAGDNGVQRISLNVGNDNYAKNLYGQLGFQVVADKGDAMTMVRQLGPATAL